MMWTLLTVTLSLSAFGAQDSSCSISDIQCESNSIHLSNFDAISLLQVSANSTQRLVIKHLHRQKRKSANELLAEIASQSNLSSSIQSSISMSILLRFKSMDNFVKHLIGSLKFDNKFEANVEFVGDVYVVGNGPIMEEDHDRLRAAGAETVFRCNGMRNLRWEEPVGVVYARKLTASGHYWGVTDDKCPRIASAKEVILIGVKGEVTEDGEEFKKKLPNVEVNGVYLSKDDKSDEPYSIDLDGTILHCPPKEHIACSEKAYGWSTGFMAMVITRQRFPNAKIHLMGMNWNEGGKEEEKDQAHPWNVEKRIIASLPWATVHKTKSKAYHDPDEKCQISSALLELEAR